LCIPKIINRTPEHIFKVFSLAIDESKAPPPTAIHVVTAIPTEAPIKTKNGTPSAARIIVAIYALSPQWAKKTKVNASQKIAYVNWSIGSLLRP